MTNSGKVTMLLLAAAVLLGCMLGGVQSACANDSAGQELEELQDDFGKLADGLEWLSRAAWVNAIKNPSYATGRVHDALSHISDRVSTAKRAVDQLSELVDEEDEDSDKEARTLAKSISKEYRDLREDGILLGELNKRRRQIRDLEVGLVSHQSHPELEVSLKLLLDDRAEAFSRFKKLAAAMEQNIALRKRQEKALEQIAEGGRAVGTALKIFSDALVDVHQYGGSVFGDLLLLKALDADTLGNASKGTAGDARGKLEKVRSTRQEEERRLKNYKTNLKTLFQISL